MLRERELEAQRGNGLNASRVQDERSVSVPISSSRSVAAAKVPKPSSRACRVGRSTGRFSVGGRQAVAGGKTSRGAPNGTTMGDEGSSSSSLAVAQTNAEEYVDLIQLLGGQLDTFVREITFLSLPPSDVETVSTPPVMLQASVNLSLANVVTCRERISYAPNKRSPDGYTTFNQSAVFVAQGRLKEGEVAAYLGRKVEANSWERFVVICV